MSLLYWLNSPILNLRALFVVVSSQLDITIFIPKKVPADLDSDKQQRTNLKYFSPDDSRFSAFGGDRTALINELMQLRIVLERKLENNNYDGMRGDVLPRKRAVRHLPDGTWPHSDRNGQLKIDLSEIEHDPEKAENHINAMGEKIMKRREARKRVRELVKDNLRK